MNTTPFEREVITFFYVSPPGAVFERITPLYHDFVKRLMKAGLLVYDAHTDSIVGVKCALKPYMEALGAVPLPTCRWEIRYEVEA